MAATTTPCCCICSNQPTDRPTVACFITVFHFPLCVCAACLLVVTFSPPSPPQPPSTTVPPNTVVKLLSPTEQRAKRSLGCCSIQARRAFLVPPPLPKEERTFRSSQVSRHAQVFANGTKKRPHQKHHTLSSIQIHCSFFNLRRLVVLLLGHLVFNGHLRRVTSQLQHTRTKQSNQYVPRNVPPSQ